jgi:hypothetical protein
MTDETCRQCGEELPCATKRRRYCSDACRQAAYRNRKPQPYLFHPNRRVTAKLPSLQAPIHLYDGLRPYVYPERVLDPRIGSKPDGSTPGALQGDDYALEYYDDGYPKLSACLDRRSHRRAKGRLPNVGRGKTKPGAGRTELQ